MILIGTPMVLVGVLMVFVGAPIDLIGVPIVLVGAPMYVGVVIRLCKLKKATRLGVAFCFRLKILGLWVRAIGVALGK